jgi:TonB-dependent receptor-like protein
MPIAAPCTTLAPLDLTAGGSYDFFRGHTDVKELALFAQDTISWKNWSFNLGIRGDVYRGITHATQAEPRLGIAYNIKPTNTVLRVSYARTLETPFNEHLVLASTGCNDAVVNALMSSLQGDSCNTAPLAPGWRNEFHAGLQQAFGKHLVVDAEYIWKYTHGAYDFSVLGRTPITFPIEWQRSTIPGYAIRASVPDFHGFTALVVMSSVAARFFEPQLSGIGTTPAGQGVRSAKPDFAMRLCSVQHSSGFRPPARKTTTRIRRASRRAICSTWRLEPAARGHQHQQRESALQLPFNLQRNPPRNTPRL